MKKALLLIFCLLLTSCFNETKNTEIDLIDLGTSTFEGTGGVIGSGSLDGF